MLENWRTPPLIKLNPPPSDAPKWRGEAEQFFRTKTPSLGFGIPQRARDIAYGFVIPKRDKYSPEYIPDEDEGLVQWFCGSLDELREHDVESIDVVNPLIRNNKSGITVFLRENGYEAVRNALISGTVLSRSSTYREVVNLIEYLRPGTLKS